jgi:hypothetical protein
MEEQAMQFAVTTASVDRCGADVVLTTGPIECDSGRVFRGVQVRGRTIGAAKHALIGLLRRAEPDCYLEIRVETLGMEHHDALNAIEHLRSRPSKARWPKPTPPRDMAPPRLLYLPPRSTR